MLTRSSGLFRRSALSAAFVLAAGACGCGMITNRAQEPDRKTGERVPATATESRSWGYPHSNGPAEPAKTPEPPGK